MRSLIVLPFIPSRNAPQAGHRLSFETVQHLAKEGDVKLLLLLKVSGSISELAEICGVDNIHVCIVGRFRYIVRWLFVGKLGYPRFFTRFSAEAASILTDLCKDNKFESIRFEFSQTFIYAGLVRRLGMTPHITFVPHDLQFQVVLRSRGVEAWFCRWAYGSEQKLLRLADEIHVLSAKDRVLVKSLLDIAKPVHIKSPPLSGFLRNLNRRPENIERNSLLFWGAMGRRENADAVVHFCRFVLAPLRTEGYRYKLYIVGSAPTPEVLALESPFVIVTGFLANPSPYFETCSLGIVPLRMGAGIKLKTLEMLAAGLRVVSSPVGAEGIEPADEALIISEVEDFGVVLKRLYEAC